LLVNTHARQQNPGRRHVPLLPILRQGFFTLRGTVPTLRQGFPTVKQGFLTVRQGFVTIRQGFLTDRQGFLTVRKDLLITSQYSRASRGKPDGTT
jgi:hypothetical protein